MRNGDQRQDAAGIGQGLLNSASRLPILPSEEAPPGLRIGLGVVEHSPDETVRIQKLLPVSPLGPQSGIRIPVTPARQPGSPSALERQRLAKFHPLASAEAGVASVAGSGCRISPQQQPLRAGPDAVQNAIAPVLVHQVTIAITQEPPGSPAEGHEIPVLPSSVGSLLLAYGRQVIGQSHVLRPVLGRHLHRQAGSQRHIDHLLVQPLGVHVHLYLTAALHDPIEYRPPEIIALLGYAAFSMYAKRHAGDAWARLQQFPQRIPAVSRMVLRCKARNRVIGLGTVDPFIRMRPQTQLKIQPPGHGLTADEPQHLQIAVAFCIGHPGHMDVVTRHRKKERVGKIEGGVSNMPGEIIAEPQGQAEAVKAL